VLSADGTGLTDEVLIATPHPCPPEVRLKIIDELITSLPASTASRSGSQVLFGAAPS